MAEQPKATTFTAEVMSAGVTWASLQLTGKGSEVSCAEYTYAICGILVVMFVAWYNLRPHYRWKDQHSARYMILVCAAARQQLMQMLLGSIIGVYMKQNLAALSSGEACMYILLLFGLSLPLEHVNLEAFHRRGFIGVVWFCLVGGSTLPDDVHFDYVEKVRWYQVMLFAFVSNTPSAYPCTDAMTDVVCYEGNQYALGGYYLNVKWLPPWITCRVFFWRLVATIARLLPPTCLLHIIYQHFLEAVPCTLTSMGMIAVLNAVATGLIGVVGRWVLLYFFPKTMTNRNTLARPWKQRACVVPPCVIVCTHVLGALMVTTVVAAPLLLWSLQAGIMKTIQDACISLVANGAAVYERIQTPLVLAVLVWTVKRARHQ